MTFLQGVLADREKWSAVGECAIEKTMAVLGTKSAMLILREAYCRTAPLGSTTSPAGWASPRPPPPARLAELVDLGLLTRQPYREPGQRSRDEYVLTEAGVDFMPVVWAMFEWGRQHLPGQNRPAGYASRVVVRMRRRNPLHRRRSSGAV